MQLDEVGKEFPEQNSKSVLLKMSALTTGPPQSLQTSLSTKYKQIWKVYHNAI
jgi:hypothetical protein